MDALLNSFFLVFVSEMGDKTQLLALVLTAKYKKPLPILAGIFVATILNHALASYVGSFAQIYVSQNILKYVLGATFIIFGLWILIPDKDEGFEEKNKWGPFLTTTIAFFFAEMGDKTQLATVALGAKYTSTMLVTLGTTLGMMGSNGLAVLFGNEFLKRVPLKIVHRFASALFIIFGIVILLGLY